MANTTLTTVIDNGSPALTYTPFADTLSVPDLFGGWNPYYDLTGFASTPGEEGNGTSRHITVRDGAQFAILNFFGTGLQLFGNITQFGTYDLQLDGQLNRSISTFSPSDSTLLASYSDLSAANHSLILTFHNPSGDNSTFISIEHAAILDGPAEGGITSTVTDDEALSFVGQWSFLQDNTLGPSDSTFHTSSNAGDHFSFLFNGSAVTLTGFHDATSGQYSVQVDSNTTVFNGASSFKEATTLFFVSGLGSGTHNMTVINQEDRLLAVGAITVNSLAESGPTPISALSGSSLSGGSIAAIVVAIVLGILVALLLGFLIWRRRRLNALRRRMFMTDNVLDSDVMDIAPDDEIEERKPPSKTSPIQREGSGNSRSFTLSLPMQTRPSHSQRGDSGNSVQELPRSPSVSLVGSQAAAAGDGSTPPRSRFLEPSQNSPFAIEFAERATRERPRVLPSASRDKGTPFPVQVVQAAPSDPALPPTPITPITATDNGEDSPIRGRRSEEAGDDAIRAIHYSFLDISSREGSSRDGRTGSVYTSSSSSERARRNRLSEQTSGSHTRPISLGYAFQYHRNSDLGLFRRAQLQQQAHDPPAPPPAVPVPPLPTDVASSELTFSPIQSSSGPLSPIRPLPRVPQSPVSIAPTIGHSRVAEDRSIPRTPPALQLQTQWAPPPPPPAHLSPERERGAFSAATSTGLTFAFGSQRESLLLQPGAIGRRRFSIPHGSPTESVPLSVSDIHFRHSSDEDPEPGSVALERLSPGDVANTPRAYASPFIMQRLRGEQATLGSPVAPRYGSPISSPSGVSSTPRRPGHTAASSDPLPGPPFAPGLEQGP